MSQAVFAGTAADPSQFPREGLPEVAFAGRSNVGKSSLINALLNRRNLARTSKSPGKTRAIQFFRINDELLFADLPGYGFARVARNLREDWGPLIEEYLAGRDHLKLLVLLLDIRRDVAADDQALLEWLALKNVPTLVVLTKIDTLSRTQQVARERIIRSALGWKGDSLAMVSARTGNGKNALWGEIRRRVL
ncbi:MAG: YihA family ribosome biogenesis GTP-binding protein [Deltaproteobacteria bacterium HGW-Deltaproteobacteria-19]|jgi:GTP-binding protein|nr:MAG: YihA family ribosome biogenesis GTP-binding protein [Deltaproteobacteria bacterium HGW-Deltaproteobacteria-19]